MSTVSTNEVQEAILQLLKASGTVVAKLANASAIKEDQWQGTHFVYPCIRVDISYHALTSVGCSLYRTQMTINCYSEKPSSYEANDIADVVIQALDTDLVYNNTIKFNSIGSYILPAQRIDENTWLSKVNLTYLTQKIK